MAKIYNTPDEAVPPPIPDYSNYDSKKQDEAEKKYLEDLREFLRSQNNGELVGEIIYHPVADGQAAYMISSHKPFSLVHLQLGDAYNAGPVWERGLRLSDVRHQLKFRKYLASL